MQAQKHRVVHPLPSQREEKLHHTGIQRSAPLHSSDPRLYPHALFTGSHKGIPRKEAPQPLLEDELWEDREARDEEAPSKASDEVKEVEEVSVGAPPEEPWDEGTPSVSTGHEWENVSQRSWQVPPDSRDNEEFVTVDVSDTDDGDWDMPFFDDSEWGKPGLRTSEAEGGPPNQDFEQTLLEGIKKFFKEYGEHAPSALRDMRSEDLPVPEGVRESCFPSERLPGGGWRLHTSAAHWLAAEETPAVTAAPATPGKVASSSPQVRSPEGKAIPISPPPPKPNHPPEKRSASTKTVTPQSRTDSSAQTSDYAFKEDEVDYGGDGEDFVDDRTPEEIADDEELLSRVRENMRIFLEAPAEIRKQLRTTAWKRRCSQLEALRLMLDRPAAPAREYTYEEDLRLGFTPEEARRMQKARRRAAQHQRFSGGEPEPQVRRSSKILGYSESPYPTARMVRGKGEGKKRAVRSKEGTLAIFHCQQGEVVQIRWHERIPGSSFRSRIWMWLGQGQGRSSHGSFRKTKAKTPISTRFAQSHRTEYHDSGRSKPSCTYHATQGCSSHSTKAAYAKQIL